MKTKKRKPIRRIKNARFKEPVIAVPCPRRIQRRMWRSLRKAVVCNINLNGKLRARELMAIAEASSEPTTPKNEVKAIAAKTDATQILSGQGTVKAAAAEKPQPAQNRLMRCVQRVSSFLKTRGRFHGNNSRC